MIKKVLVTLLVTVDTEDDMITPNGDPLTQNVVLNHIDNDDILERIYEEIVEEDGNLSHYEAVDLAKQRFEELPEPGDYDD